MEERPPEVRAESPARDLKILFVGNSYTFFWNMPAVVEYMGKSLNWEVRQSAAGGATWEDHTKGAKGLATLDKIKSADWDYVVLQNHSRSALERPVEFQEQGQKLIDLVKAHGAVPVLYCTWATEQEPEMLEPVLRGYRTLAERNGIDYIPAGEVWQSIRARQPGLKLSMDDGSHPSALGSFLNALLFYRYFSGIEAAKPEHWPFTWSRAGEKQYLLMVGKEDARLAANFVTGFFAQQNTPTLP